MDSELYDEFGNYVGPALASDDEDEIPLPDQRDNDHMVWVLSLSLSLFARVCV